MINIALENSTNFLKYGIWYTLIPNRVQNLGQTNVFLELWAHLFQENFGTGQLAKKIEGTLADFRVIAPGQHSFFQKHVAAVASCWQHCVRFDQL